MDRQQAIYDVVLAGKRKEVEALVGKALEEGISPITLLEGTLRPAMEEVGKRFARGEFYLPDLILAARTMETATACLQPHLVQETEEDDVAIEQAVVIGTIEGDLHDIGKNLVIALLKGSGYRVVDLGVDASPQQFVEAVEQNDPVVVGFSALLTTTMVSIPRAIQALSDAGLRDGRIIAVGGAPMTQRNADDWGAEIYAPDAGTAVRLINDMVRR